MQDRQPRAVAATIHRRPLGLAAALLAGMIAAAALMAANASAAGTRGALVALHSTGLGRVLADSKGRTLYLFEKDSRRKSLCSGTCLQYWPPVVTQGKPRAGAGVKASLLGTIRRSDGHLQVTYAGHPLYRFALDLRAGQTKGEELSDFGATWYVLSPKGTKIEKELADASSGTSSGGTTGGSAGSGSTGGGYGNGSGGSGGGRYSY